MAQNNMTLTVPLIGVLDQEGIDIIKRSVGTPYYSTARLSEELGHEYDRITFVILTDYNNQPFNIIAQNNNININQNNCIEIWMPIQAFNRDFMVYLHRQLANIDIDNFNEWAPYINRGGDDRFLIRLMRLAN